MHRPQQHLHRPLSEEHRHHWLADQACQFQPLAPQMHRFWQHLHWLQSEVHRQPALLWHPVTG
uniref:Uncharacterized protein n=1 Tax=Setaria italica TaxID=4555 RepID=K3ZPF8_SETIT